MKSGECAAMFGLDFLIFVGRPVGHVFISNTNAQTAKTELL